MNNPMQFIDVAHEKDALLNLYSEQYPMLDGSMPGVLEDTKDPGNLHRLILKHLIKVTASPYLRVRIMVITISVTYINYTINN